jgi:PAS domain S-box-containing protein
LLSINAAPVFTPDGTFSGMVASLQDITETTRAEEQIARKDELLRMTGEMAQVGGWEFDVATGEGTWTDEVARIHGLDPTAPTNVGLGVSFYVGESQTRIEAAIDQAVEHGIPYDLELEICAANGEHKWVRTKGVPVQKQGRTSQLRGTFQDITERKLAEQALREREERLSLALSIAHMGYWRYEVASGALQEYEEHGALFGVATDGRDWTLAGVQILVHPDDRAYAEMALQRTVAEGVPFDSTYRTVLPSGETRWLHSLGHLHSDASGRPDYVFGVTQDITDRKRAEADKEAV